MTVPIDTSQPVNEPSIDLEGTCVETEDVPPIQKNNLPAAVPKASALPEELAQDLDLLLPIFLEFSGRPSPEIRAFLEYIFGIIVERAINPVNFFFL